MPAVAVSGVDSMGQAETQEAGCVQWPPTETTKVNYQPFFVAKDLLVPYSQTVRQNAFN